LTILGTQGLVIRGWPYPVLMCGQLCKSNARTKGIADLSLSDRRRLHAALTDEEISVTKVQSKQDRSMYLKYVHNIVLICGVLSEALCDSELPVIIGAPPPADSGHAKAQQMYVNGTIDHEGPPRLPPSKAVTRIKRGVTDEPKTMEGDAIRRIDGAHRRVIYSQATKNNPIVISSNDSVRSAKTKAVPKKKKSKYIIVSDSSDEEAVATIDRDVNAGGADVSLVAAENPYQEPGPTLKRKANALPTAHPTKKPVKTALKKGKQRASSRTHDGEDLGSESDFPNMLMTQGMSLYLTRDVVQSLMILQCQPKLVAECHFQGLIVAVVQVS